MQSIRVPFFSENLFSPVFISIPILNQAALIQRVDDLAIKHQCTTRYLKEKNHVNCREIFQENGKPEIFFFPSSTGKCVSLQMMNFGEMFFLSHHSYGLIFCFNPNAKSKSLSKTKTVFFCEAKGYPAGVSEAASFFFSATHISILVSEHGRMTANSDGEWIFRGIKIALLQRIRFHGKSVFVQKTNECVSPNRPLSENFGTVNPLQMNKKYIKVRCICKPPEFCYSAQFPVLSVKELKQEILEDERHRLMRYGHRSHLYTSGPLQHSFLQNPKNKHMIMFPHGMGINVPFGNVQGGRMFFSSADTTCHGSSLEECMLTFFPPLFGENENLQISATKIVKNFYRKEKDTALSFCGSTKATIFTSSRIRIVSCSSSEYQLVGAKVEMISTKNHGGWGICFSCETINLANSPIPGPSGIESRDPIIQATATVSVPTRRQGQQTQQKRNSPLPGPSGIERRKATASFFQEGDTSESPKRQQEDSIFVPASSGFRDQVIRSIPFSPQEASIVYVPPEQQSQQTPYKHPAPGPSGVRYHPYPQHGMWPFSKGEQTQQKGRSNPSGSSGIKNREATASFFQAEDTVSVSPESESPQRQQGSSNLVPAPSGFRDQVIRLIPFRPQEASIVYIPPERQSQQASDSQQTCVRYHPYPQYGPWSFNEGFHSYFYPGTGSFVGGFYPYGSLCPHPSARQDQWMPVLPSCAPSVRPPVAALEPLRYDIPAQKEGVGHSGREEEASASVSVGAVQQTFMWRPDEESSSVVVSSQAQAENSDEGTEIDIEN